MKRTQLEEATGDPSPVLASEGDEQWQQLSAAEGYAELGMYTEAHQQLDQADSCHDLRLEVAIRKLDLFVLEGRWHDAVIYGEVLTDLLPDDQAPLMKYARALHELGHTDRAIDALSLAPESSERDPDYQFVLAGYELELGSREDALRHLENAIALEPEMRARAWADPQLRTLISELPWEPRFVDRHPDPMLLPPFEPADLQAGISQSDGLSDVEFFSEDEEDPDCPF